MQPSTSKKHTEVILKREVPQKNIPRIQVSYCFPWQLILREPMASVGPLIGKSVINVMS